MSRGEGNGDTHTSRPGPSLAEYVAVERALADYAKSTAPLIARSAESRAASLGADMLECAQTEQVSWACLSATLGQMKGTGPDALLPEDLVHAARAAWSRVQRPQGCSEEQWTTAYIRVLGRCLEAYFAADPGSNTGTGREPPRA